MHMHDCQIIRGLPHYMLHGHGHVVAYMHMLYMHMHDFQIIRALRVRRRRTARTCTHAITHVHVRMAGALPDGRFAAAGGIQRARSPLVNVTGLLLLDAARAAGRGGGSDPLESSPPAD